LRAGRRRSKDWSKTGEAAVSASSRGAGHGPRPGFIFANPIAMPILNIDRKYYGGRMTHFLFVTSYASMAVAGLLV